MLEIQFDESKLANLQRNLDTYADSIELGYVRSLNSAAFDTRAMMLKTLSESIATDQDRISSKLSVREATDKNAKVAVLVSDRRISLRHFNPKQTRRGVVYRVRKSGGQVFVPSAFGPEIRRLGNDVWKREGKARTPIKRVPGPSLAEETVNMGLDKEAELHFRSTFVQRLRDYLTRINLLGIGGQDLVNG